MENFTKTQGERMTRIVYELSGWDRGDAESAMTTDCISKQAAIDKFNRFIEMCKEISIGRVVFTIDDAKYAFIKIVESVEPVHGKWVYKDVVKNEDNTIEEWQEMQCSVCGKWHTTPYAYYIKDYNYCPNCGAKMEEEEKEK